MFRGYSNYLDEKCRAREIHASAHGEQCEEKSNRERYPRASETMGTLNPRLTPKDA